MSDSPKAVFLGYARNSEERPLAAAPRGMASAGQSEGGVNRETILYI